MREIDVTFIVDDYAPTDFAASRAELGEDAGRITWHRAMDAAEEWEPDGIDYGEVRAYFRSFGAWTEEEIAAWEERELRAMLIQDAAGSIREEERGGEDGRMYRGDDGRMYLYVGE